MIEKTAVCGWTFRLKNMLVWIIFNTSFWWWKEYSISLKMLYPCLNDQVTWYTLVRVLRGYTFENKQKGPTVFEDAAIPLITKMKTVFKFDKWKWSHFHLTTFGEVIFAWKILTLVKVFELFHNLVKSQILDLAKILKFSKKKLPRIFFGSF